MTSGKRVGSRRAERTTPAPNGAALANAAGITACVIAWGYLVLAAVDFGSSARGGNSQAWILLTLAAVGAAACLFVGLMLVLRLLAALGLNQTSSDEGEAAPRPPGGRRAAR